MSSAYSLVSDIAFRLQGLTTGGRNKTAGRIPPETVSNDSFSDRQSGRTPTFRFARICSEDGMHLVDATIRETSSRGAKLRLSSAICLPDRIIIRTQHDQSDHIATLKWISGASVGIEFDAEIAIPKKPPTEAERNRVIQAHLFG